jgi:hypothetical protein
MIELAKHITPVLGLLSIGIVLSLLLFKMHKGEVKKKGYVMILLFGVGGGIIGGIASLLYRFEIITFTFTYLFILLQLIALLAGVLFINVLYNQLWARRSLTSWSADSVLPEFAYLLVAGQVYAFFSILIFWAVHPPRHPEAISLWSLFFPFILPYVCLKTYDLFNHIPDRDFKTKWRYTLHALNENNWRNEMSITFIVAESLEHENKLFARKARMLVRAPRREWCLGDIFRIALKTYHENNPSIEVFDVGDDIKDDFWWLFKYKFSLFQPKSWFPGKRYLDANMSIEDNGVQLNSVICVKRILDQG